jgi:2-iminobutanoate/2-iminopropanoate deaminase
VAVQPIDTPSAQAAGPYTPAVRAGDWVVVSGQIGVDPATGTVVPGGIEAQARQALTNLAGVLHDCGATWADVAKVTMFVAAESPQWMQEVNAIYEEAVGPHRPARSTVGVAWLPAGASIEVEAWAHLPEPT